MELFEDSKFNMTITNEPIDPKKFNTMTTNDYLQYLTQGFLKNRGMFEFSKKIKARINVDLLTQFNMKSLGMVDSLVNEVLERIKFKDLCTGTNHRNLQKQAFKSIDFADSSKNYIH